MRKSKSFDLLFLKINLTKKVDKLIFVCYNVVNLEG